MDKGAHFYRTDFQVHSPRDRNWKGPESVSDAERQQIAREYVQACRSKGIQAIAITDHHDFAFVPYIRAAASEEALPSGDLVPERDRLLVFPGLELTLGVPCQALLIFDATFPDDLLSLVLTALAIHPAPSTESRTAQTARLDGIDTFEVLHAELNEHTFLRNRYIVFPNVSEGGNTTLMRSGLAGKYRQMPCVGGYLDGEVKQLGKGNLSILKGLDQSWGPKSLALFQTSDCPTASDS